MKATQTEIPSGWFRDRPEFFRRKFRLALAAGIFLFSASLLPAQSDYIPADTARPASGLAVVNKSVFSRGITLYELSNGLSLFIQKTETDLATVRAGRANPHVLDKLRVDYYGTPTPIQQIGNVTVPEPRMLQIAPWEKKLIKDIEKAILASDIGITPSNDGSVVRLVFPELTEERRKDLAKEVKKKGEEGKVAVRNIRRDGNDAFKKLAKTEISEDEIKGLEEELQKLTDKYIKDIDKAIDEKAQEIMKV